MSERNLHAYKVPLSALECFEAAAETGSWSAAVAAFSFRNVKINRWAIERQVDALEGYLDVQLFRRTPNAVYLTAAGEHYLSEVPSLLENAAAARHRVQLISPPKWEKVELGYTPSPTVEFRECSIDRFEASNSSAPIKPNELSGDACKSEVAAGRLLLALMPKPLHMPPSMEFFPLVEYPICVVVSGKDPRFATAKLVAAQELRNERWLRLNRKEFEQHNEYVRNVLSPHFTPLFADEEYDGHETLLSAAYHRQGVGLFLSTIARFATQQNVNVRVLAFDPPIALVQVGAIYRTPQFKVVGDFVDAAIAAVKSIRLSNGRTPLQGRVLCSEIA